MHKLDSSCTKRVMKRRDFIAGLVTAAAARPDAWGQKEGMRRVGVLTGLAEDDPATKARLSAFREGMVALGWARGAQPAHRCPLRCRFVGNCRNAGYGIARAQARHPGACRFPVSPPQRLRQKPYRSSSWLVSIRLGPAGSRASPIPAATLPVFPRWNRASVQNGSIY